MRIKHSFGSFAVEKESRDCSFILTNHKGGYAHFYSKPNSRYQGFFVFNNQRMFKIIESISCDTSEISHLHNLFYKVEQRRSSTAERFFVPYHHDALCYATDKKGQIEITLDVRDTYDNRVWGRYYEILDDKECTLVHFTKRTDSREDSSHDQLEYEFFIAFKADGKIELVNQWVERSYEEDQERNSYPSNRHVYKAIKANGTRFVCAASQKREDAIKECLSVFRKQSALEKEQEKMVLSLIPNKSILKKMPLQTAMAYVACALSLSGLVVHAGKRQALIAGLPWFYQIWARDELISLGAMMRLKQYDLVIDGLKRNANMMIEGTLMGNALSSLASADAPGWLFVRLRELDKKSRVEKLIPPSILENAVRAQIKKYTNDDFAVSHAKETWMDSLERDGIRIEIQALRLAMYRFLYEKTKKKEYKANEDRLLKKVREKIWNGNYLNDGLTDLSIRPNLFIAYYAYPQLLGKDEWKKCMRTALEKLWLSFGGLATIDTTSPLFQKEHTGENPLSYHNGDSWFWINNLAAVCLVRIDKKAFKEHIEKISGASVEEILWSGAVGHHAELSSACELKSQGCLAQAWSAALFIELMHELY